MGILMVQHHIDENEAFAVLRRHSLAGEQHQTAGGRAPLPRMRLTWWARPIPGP
ncbi:ANTAR domain-containing protein [Streptomyces sp. NPDC046716]|uniref:ANTAR domain-containing protein n=1 Tax=Streptomyces sp. NPDC046716 TaxID=3157093 RepID=UPI0033F2F0E1